MMSVEHSHVGVVSLWRLGPCRPTVLYHQVTGEVQPIDGAWELCFDGRGIAYITPIGGEVGEQRWANSVFQSSWHREIAGEQRDIIRRRHSEHASVVKDLVLQANAAARTFSFEGMDFACELYQFKAPIRLCASPGSSSWFWTMPWPVDFLFPKNRKPNNRWTGRFVPATIQEMMEVLDFREAGVHARRSKKSYSEQARQAGQAIPASHIGNIEEEFSISTHALLTWLLAWGSGAFMKGWGEIAGDLKTNSGSLLRLLVGTFLDDGEYDVRIRGQALPIRQRGMSLGEFFTAVAPCKRRLVQLGKPPRQAPLVDIMIALAAIAFGKTGKAEAILCAQEALRGLVEFLACAWEFGQAGATGDRLVFMALPTLVGPGGKARRVPPGKKVAMCSAVHASPEIKTPAQIVAVESILAKAKRKADDAFQTVSPKTANKYRKTASFSYFMLAAETFKSARHFSIALDGARVGGQKLLVSAFYSTEVGQGCWLAPQAPPGIRAPTSRTPPPPPFPGTFVPRKSPFPGTSVPPPLSRHVWARAQNAKHSQIRPETPVSKHVCPAPAPPAQFLELGGGVKGASERPKGAPGGPRWGPQARGVR